MSINKTSNDSVNDFTTAYINYNSVISVVRITLVLLSRGGLVLIQAGSVPTECSYDILLQNIVEFAVTTSSYGLLGVLLSFGKSSYIGLIGYGPWDYTQITCDNIVFGFGVVIIGSAIVTTFLVGRLHFIGYVIIAFIYGGFTQPIIMHWIWHNEGWMNNMKLLDVPVKFYDHAGALVVHASSGLIGLIGVVFLGRRLIRLSDIDESSLGTESPNTTLLGYLLLTNGLIGLSLPYKQPDLFHENGYMSVVVINSILGLSGGITAAIILEFILWRDIFNYWVLLRLIQGGIAGLVLISSSINYCYPPASFAVTFVGGILVICTSKLIYKSALEDYCNIIPIHLFCGLWSPILQPFIARIRTMKSVELLWQITCTTIIMSCFFGLYSLLFLILYCTGFLRCQNEENCHKRSMNVVKDAHRCPFKRMFTFKAVNMLEPGSSGKTPNNLDSDLESNESVSDLITRKSSVMNKSSSSSKSDKKNENSNIIDNHKTLDKVSPKPKNIYTLHNCIPFKKNTYVNQQERQFCSGDPADDVSVHKLEDLIASQSKVRNKNTKKEIVNIKQKILRTKSHIRLSKSKRYIDFSKHKKLMKSKGKNRNNALVNIYINRSSELIAYDKKYNDGIVTYKIPRLLEYISD